MKTRFFIGALLCMLSPLPVYSQYIGKGEIDLEAFAEELFSVQEEELDYEDLYESLLQVYLNPIHLNQTNAEELQSLNLLNPGQVNGLVTYIQLYGPLISIYELQAVPELDLETIYKLLPFVRLVEGETESKKPLLQRIGQQRDAYWMIRHRRVWETRRGYTAPDTLASGQLTSRYRGDPNDVYARFRTQHPGDFSLGFTLDKDPGEEFIWDPATRRYGFNFLSYHFTLYNQKKWKTLTLGDYQMQFGQGLVFGAGFAVGKGAETISTIRRSSIGIRPYTSVLEHGFFRGAAATYRLGRVEITAMFSDAPRDGSLQSRLDTMENQEDFIVSLNLSGLHRTPTEIANKSQAREQNAGGNIQYKSKNNRLQIGANSLFTKYSQPFERTDRVYNGFEFRGKENNIHSAYLSYNFRNYFFFSESAVSKSGGTGTVLGMMASIHSSLDVSVLWRDFDRDFHSFYGNAFSEGSRPINEKGIYLGIKFKPNPKFQWTGYYDRFYFPWLRFRAYAPSSGKEWLNRFTYSPNRDFVFFLQLREEMKDRNIVATEQQQAHYQLSTGIKRNLVANLDYAINNSWGIKSRVQYSSFRFNANTTKGYAILQDINYQQNNWKWSARMALFDTEDFDNRQYVYEKNVLWAFSIPNYYGQGLRYYLLGQYKISNQITLWARWGRTSYTDREMIGSGLQEIKGSTISETTVQLRYQFNR